MAVTGAPCDWQLECENVEQRCGYLLKYELWSDCTFVLGSETKQEIRAHKLILASASPVFEAMLYGGLSEPNDPIVPIPDVEPEAFKALLQYIYKGDINIDSFDLACDLWISADMYMLPHLVKKCKNYIYPIVGPSNACRVYELALLFDDTALVEKCMQIISKKTKEVLNDSSFEEVELNTVITVCSLDHLTVDSELDLFRAVKRYAEAKQMRQGQSSPPEVLPSAGSSSELDSKPIEVKTTDNKEDLKKEEPSIHTAIQRIRFLSLTAQEFAACPGRSDLLTKDEKLAIFMNIGSTDGAEPTMPPGFSESRERRQPPSSSQPQRFEPGSLDHTINALRCGNPLEVQKATLAACSILNTSRNFQPALDKGILDALVPALTEGDEECKNNASGAIFSLCDLGSPSQLSVLAASAALQPYCRLMTVRRGHTCTYILGGLSRMLQKFEQTTKPALLLKLRGIGVPQLLVHVWSFGQP